MGRILMYKQFLLKEGALSKKLENMDKEYVKYFSSFISPLIKMIKKFKKEYNDNNDPNDIQLEIREYLKKSLFNLIKETKKVREVSYLERIMNDISNILIFFSEEFNKLKERERFYGISKLSSVNLLKLNTLLSKSELSEYLTNINSKNHLDDKKKEAISFIEDKIEKYLESIKDIEPEDIFNTVNLDEKDSDDFEYEAGDDVKYRKNDGEENIAMVSNDQEDLKSENHIRLVSKIDGSNFEIEKNDLVEIIKKENTINQEIKNKVRKIIDDDEKLDKLNDFLDKLIE